MWTSDLISSCRADSQRGSEHTASCLRSYKEKLGSRTAGLIFAATCACLLFSP